MSSYSACSANAPSTAELPEAERANHVLSSRAFAGLLSLKVICTAKVRRRSSPLRWWGTVLAGWAAGVGLMLGAVGEMEAQTAHFGSQITLFSSSVVNAPSDVKVDGSGNVYIADTGNNRVLKETLSGGTYTQSTVGSGLSGPGGLELDGSGNVYIVDSGNNRVLKETLSGGTYTQSTVASGLSFPLGVAVDGSGNVYIADNGSNRVLKETLSGGIYTQTTLFGTGLSLPSDVKVDGSGNVYIADTGNNRVLKETLSGGTYTPSTVGSGLSSPSGLALDGSGNVYIADFGDARALKETLSGGTYTQSTVGSGLAGPTGVAVDGSGNVYIADNSANSVVEVTAAAPSFVPIAVGSTSGAQTEIFTFDTGGAISAPVVLAQGAPGLDFKDAGTGSCTTNGTSHTYAAGDTCTVEVTFSPKFAGARNGAVQLTTSSGAVIASAYLQGTGTGPQAVLYPGTQTVPFSTGLTGPSGVAVDGSGNVYIADTGNNRMLKETLSGGIYTQSTVGSGLSGPSGVAVDGSGNVYIADAGNSRVLKETLSGGTYAQSTVGSGLSGPEGVAVDGSGNVYIADTSNNRVLKETLSEGVYAQSTVGSGLNLPPGVAVDGVGNVYIADSGNNRVLKETLSGGNYTQSTVGSGLSRPGGLAVDGSGNVYIADTGNNRVLQETLSGGTYTQSTVGSGLSGPDGVAVDGSGNVLISDTSHNRVVKVDVADSQTLTFASTDVGSTSASQTVTLVNIGNASLTLPAPGSVGLLNPSIAANFSYAGSSTCPQIGSSSSNFVLTAGDSCSEIVSFAPTASGAITGHVVNTDDNLNVSNTMQSVTLSGTGTNIVPAVTAVSPATGPTAGGTTVTITGTNLTGATAVLFGGTPATSFVVVSATQITATSPPSTAGTDDITVTTSGGTSATSLADQFSYLAPQVISFTQPTTPVVFGTAPVTLTATGGASGNPVVFSVISGPATVNGITLTYTGVGTVVVEANQAGSAVYSAAAPVERTIVVNAAPQVISFTQPTTPVVFGTAPVTLTATGGASGNPVVFSVISGPATISGVTLTYTGVGTVVVEADQAGSAVYSAAAPVERTILVNPVPQVISFAQPTTPVVNGAAPVTLTATGGASGNPVVFSVISGPATVSGVTLTYTGTGTVVVEADQAGSAIYAAAAPVQRTIVVNAAATAYTVPATAVGVASATQTATITFTQAATLNSNLATAIQVVTQGATGLDYGYVAGGTCVAGASYALGQACTVEYSFTPKAPGQRLGAINLYNNGSTPLAVGTAFVHGLGTSGLGLFSTGIAANVGASLSSVRGISLDSAGNIYASEQANGNVDRFAAGTGVKTVLTTAGDSPSGSAVDGAGNVYFGSQNDQAIYELIGGTGNPAQIASGWIPDNVLLVDGAGNLYSSDESTGAIYEIAAGTHAVTIQLAGAPGTGTRFIGMALDASGNLFAADFGNNRMFEIAAGNTTATLLFSDNGLAAPDGVAVDAAGNIYVTNDLFDGNVLRYAAGTYAMTELPTGSANAGIAIDSSGNLLVLDNNDITRYTRTSTPALNFNGVAIGGASSSQTTGFENDGNAPLTFSTLTTTSSNFTLDATTTTCSTSSMLAAGTTCNMGAKFTPQSLGALTDTINITDDTLNVAGTLQQVSLSGTGTQASPALVVSNASIPYGTASTTLSATVTYVSGFPPTGAFTFTVGSGSAVPATCTATTSTTENCTASYQTSALTAHSYTITGTLTADTNYTAGSNTGTLTVTQATSTLSGPAHQPVVLTYNQGGSFTVMVAGQNSGAGISQPSGTVTYTIGSGAAQNAAVANGVATIAVPTTEPANSYTVTVNYAGDSNYSAAPPITVQLQVNKATAIVTLGTLSATYDGNPHAATATTTPSGLNVTFTYNGSAAAPTAANSYTVVGTINDSNYSGTATGTLVISQATTPINFAVANHNYGDGPFAVSASSQSTGAFTYTVISGPASVSGSTVTITGAGAVVLQASQATMGNYTANTQQASFNVAKASLTATTNNSTRLYGAANPAFSGTVSGAKYNDTFTESFSTSATTISPVNTYVITPTVSGEALANYNLAATTGTLTVTQAPVELTVTTSSAAITPGQTATLTAAVTSTTTGTPTGSVTFYDNGAPLPAVTLAGGTASYVTTLSPGISHTITASYSGDTNFLSAQSPAPGGVTTVVAPLDFSFTDSGPATLTVVPGQTVTYTFQVAATYGVYPGPVTFSVMGLPAGATATFTPSGLPQNGGAIQVQMSVQTAKTTSSSTPVPLGRGTLPVAIAGLLLPLIGLRRRTRTTFQSGLILLLIGGVLGVGAMTGCGVRQGFLSNDSVHNYTLMVTSTSGSVEHTQTVTLNVQ